MLFSNLRIIGKLRQVITVLFGLFFILAFTPGLYAATYYVDATLGTDDNDGLSEATAWKTIAKVNASSFVPGDSILFNRGDTWREQLTVPGSGSSGSPITYGAYGSGVLPIINGSNIMTGFANGGSNIWDKTGVTTQPNIAIIGGSLGTHVASRAACTAPGNWYWTGNTLSVYATSDPSGNIEAGQRDYGIWNSYAYITIQNIHTTKTNHSGIRCDDIWSGHGIIYNPQTVGVTSDYNYNNGIMFGADGANSVNVLCQNNTVNYNGASGIFIGNWDATVTGVTIQNNTLNANCWQSTSPFLNTIGGIYVTSTGNGSAYDHTTTNAVIQYNTVTGTANDPGIWMDTVGSNVIVQYNNSYSNYDGFMVEDSDGVQVSYNLSYNNTRLGIHVDRLVHNNLVYNNTIYGCDTGLATGWTDPSAGGVTGNLIKNNISWGNTTTAFSANNGGQNDGTNGSGNVYANNILGPEAINFIAWGASKYSTLAAWQTTSSQSGNLASDPLFVSIATPDFHLLSSSPAIKGGTSVGLTRDYVGNPVGTPPTIGAYEYYSLLPPIGLRIIQ